jgi:hypothetical protein
VVALDPRSGRRSVGPSNRSEGRAGPVRSSRGTLSGGGEERKPLRPPLRARAYLSAEEREGGRGRPSDPSRAGVSRDLCVGFGTARRTCRRGVHGRTRRGVRGSAFDARTNALRPRDRSTVRVQNFEDSRQLQFARIIALCCVLPRSTSQGIRCYKSCAWLQVSAPRHATCHAPTVHPSRAHGGHGGGRTGGRTGGVQGAYRGWVTSRGPFLLGTSLPTPALPPVAPATPLEYVGRPYSEDLRSRMRRERGIGEEVTRE